MGCPAMMTILTVNPPLNNSEGDKLILPVKEKI